MGAGNLRGVARREDAVSDRERLLVSRFARAIATYEAQATVQREAAERLAELMGRHFHVLGPRILEVGCGTGLLTRRLLARFAPAELVANDLAAGALPAGGRAAGGLAGALRHHRLGLGRAVVR